MKVLSILVLILVLTTGCGGVTATVSPAQPSSTPAPVPTATPNAQATADAQAAAAATTQVQASATAQAIASATSQAQSTATAQGQSTARAQQTAAAAATTQALNATVDALVQSAKKAYGPTDGTLELVTKNVTNFTAPTLFTAVFLRNFVAEARFFNPADRTIHPWDYGFAFRHPPQGRCPQEYRFRLISDQTFEYLLLSGKTNPDQTCDSKRVSTGPAKQMDISPTGANTLRLVVQDKAAYVFVNGEYLVTLDSSENDNQGDIWIGTGSRALDLYPGLATRYTGFIVSALP